MCTKLGPSFVALLLLAVYSVGCSPRSESRHSAEGSVIASELLTQPSRKAIEERIYSVAQEEVAAGDATYLFLTRGPYRGTPTPVIYCYEKIPERNDQWLFRGYYPINLWEIYGTNLTCSRDIGFTVRSNEVSINCNGFEVYTIRSVSKIIRMKGP